MLGDDLPVTQYHKRMYVVTSLIEGFEHICDSFAAYTLCFRCASLETVVPFRPGGNAQTKRQSRNQ